jgi:hypothetical protein
MAMAVALGTVDLDGHMAPALGSDHGGGGGGGSSEGGLSNGDDRLNSE